MMNLLSGGDRFGCGRWKLLAFACGHGRLLPEIYELFVLHFAITVFIVGVTIEAMADVAGKLQGLSVQ